MADQVYPTGADKGVNDVRHGVGGTSHVELSSVNAVAVLG
jgi:hypothetical protein